MTRDSSPTRRTLVLGGADAGKTTFLVQLHGRVAAGTGRLRSRGAPETLNAVEQGLRRLQQGLAVRHTSHGTETSQSLLTITAAGEPIDVVVPDYAGEDLQRVLTSRRIPERWRIESARSDDWLLLVRLSKHPDLPDVLSRPIGELARSPLVDTSGETDTLPADMWSVELLQTLTYWRQQDSEARRRPLNVTLVLSCWDELDAVDGTAPEEIAAAKLALLFNFGRSRWPERFRVAGLSSQGRALDDKKSAVDYLDHGPQGMGWVVAADGRQDSDLTRLIFEP